MKQKKSDHTSITGKTFHGTEPEFYLANKMPAERWTCADGREVLVNGFEEPFWHRRPSVDATQADPHERVYNVVCTERLYSDAHRHHEKRAIAKTWVDDFRAGYRITLTPESREYASNAAFKVEQGYSGRRWL